MTIGSYCIVEQGARIGDGCQLSSRVVVKSCVEMGPANQVFEGAVLGSMPADSQRNPSGRLRIGSNNIFRENTTISAASGEHETVVGNHVFLMGGVHVSKNCRIDDHVIVAQNSILSDQVTVGERAFVSGLVLIQKSCRIGKLAMIGAAARVAYDVLPFMTVDGVSRRVVGLNRVGLKRSGCTPGDFRELKAAYRLIFRSGLKWPEILDRLRNENHSDVATHLREFLASATRGFVLEGRPPRDAPFLRDAEEADETWPRLQTDSEI